MREKFTQDLKDAMKAGERAKVDTLRLIDAALKDEAQNMGYTVVDAGTVIATHLNHLITTHASELLGRTEVQALLGGLKGIEGGARYAFDDLSDGQPKNYYNSRIADFLAA